MLVVGEPAAAAAFGLRLGDVERDDVGVHGLAVVLLGPPVSHQRLRRRRPQQVGTALGLVELDRQWLTHVGHHREVEQRDRIDLVSEPVGVGLIVLDDGLVDLTPLRQLVDLVLGPGLCHSDLRLLLEAVALLTPLQASLVGRADRLQRTAYSPAENEDQPPEVREELHHLVHTAMMPPAARATALSSRRASWRG